MSLRESVARGMFERAIEEIRVAYQLSTPEEFKTDMCQLFTQLGHVGCTKCKAAA